MSEEEWEVLAAFMSKLKLKMDVGVTDDFVAFQYEEEGRTLTLKLHFNGNNEISMVDQNENKCHWIGYPEL